MLDRGRKPVVIAVFARTRYFAKVRVDGSNPFARSIFINGLSEIRSFSDFLELAHS
jgi:hypothetical protein